MYQRTENRPTDLFGHIFGETSIGHLVTFTGQQARFRDADARQNELAGIQQRSFEYPNKAEQAAEYLLAETAKHRDAYFGVHLYREPGNRRARNATGKVSALWMDEDEGRYPEEGPEPTAIVRSSRNRRQLYWALTHPVSAEWAVDMNRRLAAWAGGDAGKAVLSSVLRAAGTVNYKRHPQVDPVSMVLTGAGPWEPEVLEQAIPPASLGSPRFRGGDLGDLGEGPSIASIDLARFLKRAGVEILAEVPDDGGVKFQVICPWVDEHGGQDRTGTYCGQFRLSGATWFACRHDHCAHRGWAQFKKATRWNRLLTVERPGFVGARLTVEIRYE